jgi:hypothetical protein
MIAHRLLGVHVEVLLTCWRGFGQVGLDLSLVPAG